MHHSRKSEVIPIIPALKPADVCCSVLIKVILFSIYCLPASLHHSVFIEVILSAFNFLKSCHPIFQIIEVVSVFLNNLKLALRISCVRPQIFPAVRILLPTGRKYRNRLCFLFATYFACSYFAALLCTSRLFRYSPFTICMRCLWNRANCTAVNRITD